MNIEHLKKIVQLQMKIPVCKVSTEGATVMFVVRNHDVQFYVQIYS